MNELYLESKIRELDFARSDRKQPVLSSADILAISPSIDHVIRKAIQDGKISEIKMNADWGSRFIMLKGIYPSGNDYSVRVLYIV